MCLFWLGNGPFYMDSPLSFHHPCNYKSSFSVAQLKEERDEEEDDAKSPPQDNSVPRKKKKDRVPTKDPLPKAPKLKISSNSLLKDERVSNAFKFEDAELKGTTPQKTERAPHPSGKRRKTEDKIKIDIETDRMKLSKQKLAFKKSTRFVYYLYS